MFKSDRDLLFVKFLKKMIQKDPTKRTTVTELLDDEWLTYRGKHLMVLYKPRDMLEPKAFELGELALERISEDVSACAYN